MKLLNVAATLAAGVIVAMSAAMASAASLITYTITADVSGTANGPGPQGPVTPFSSVHATFDFVGQLPASPISPPDRAPGNIIQLSSGHVTLDGLGAADLDFATGGEAWVGVNLLSIAGVAVVFGPAGFYGSAGQGYIFAGDIPILPPYDDIYDGQESLAPVAVDIFANNNLDGFNYFFHVDVPTPDGPRTIRIDGFENGVFSATTSTAPEPAAWALMILGLGGVGAGMRRRRAMVRVASVPAFRT